MKQISKITNYLDQEEAQAIRVFIAQSGKSLNEWAKKLGISKSYLSLILNGKRAFTHDLEQRFYDLGIILQ